MGICGLWQAADLSWAPKWKRMSRMPICTNRRHTTSSSATVLIVLVSLDFRNARENGSAVPLMRSAEAHISQRQDLCVCKHNYEPV